MADLSSTKGGSRSGMEPPFSDSITYFKNIGTKKENSRILTSMSRTRDALPDEEHRGFVPELFHWRPSLILLAPHIAAFLQQRLPIERRASPNTCDHDCCV